MGTLSSWLILTAGSSVIAALVLSLYLISEHLCAYNQPEEQKFLIGLILMVPVYAVESFFSLLSFKIAFFCEMMRDCYEAIAMYCFERYLVACLGGEEATIKFMQSQTEKEESTIEFVESQTDISSSTHLLDLYYDHGVVKHPFPLSYFVRSWYLGPEFYYSVKFGIVQYMILKPTCAMIAIILEYSGAYGEGKFDWRYGYPYLAVILNFSQSWALYCLIKFYTITKDKLKPIKPLPKFLTFKSIVFLTWWQGVAIAFLSSTGLFKGHLVQALESRIQDYIICLEMGVAAVVHTKVFPAKPYRRGERCIRNVDVLNDYASLGSPLDPEEVRESERLMMSTGTGHIDDTERRRLSFPETVRDVIVGSSEIVASDVKFTVSQVIEPWEQRLMRVNETIHEISENVKQLDHQKRRAKDDSYVIPLRPWTEEFSGAHDHAADGSLTDSGLRRERRRRRGLFEFSAGRCF